MAEKKSIILATLLQMIIDLAHILLKSFPQESIIEFLAVLIAFGTIALLLKYRRSPEVKYMILIEISAAVWAFAYGMEFLNSTLETKMLWSQLSYLGFSFLPLFYFLFTTVFSQKNHVITPLNVTLLSIVPFLTLVFIFTNNYHQLIWREVTLAPESNMLLYRHGLWFWVFWAYSITLIAAGLYNLFSSIYKFTAYYKSHINTLLVATLIPLGGNIMYVTGLNPFPGFDWTPVLFVFTGLVITYGIINYRMFDLVPIARNKLIETMSDGVLVINSEGFIEDYNPAVKQIFNQENMLMVRKRFSDVFPQYENLLAAIEEKNIQLVEINTGDQDKQKYFQARISPIYDRNQQFSGHLIQINDITSLKETELKLKKANGKLEIELEERGRLIEDLDAFAHTVAHDLRNSLGSIYSSGEMIRMSIKKGEIELLDDMAGLIQSASNKAMNITQELLILATINHQEVELKPLDMARIFDSAKNQINEFATKNNALIIAPEMWPKVLGYASWLEEVWTNYLNNAIKYGGEPPVIEVGADSSQNNHVRFWIKDNGNGISPENHHRLFRKYTRLSPEKAEGYGLGLSIVKRIMEKLGGNVGFESTGNKGEGSCFWFELPLINTYQN